MTDENEQKDEQTGPDVPETEGTPDQQTETTPPAEDQVAQIKDLLLRKAAEFENYKRRTETDMASIIRVANEGLIVAFLPVVDDLERSVKAARANADGEVLLKGVELILQKLLKVLESRGVTPLETEGKPFDVHFHDALMQVPKDDVPHHTILQEVERGYTMNGKVIRHAKVVVSTASADTDTTGDASGAPSPEAKDASA